MRMETLGTATSTQPKRSSSHIATSTKRNLISRKAHAMTRQSLRNSKKTVCPLLYLTWTTRTYSLCNQFNRSKGDNTSLIIFKCRTKQSTYPRPKRINLNAKSFGNVTDPKLKSQRRWWIEIPSVEGRSSQARIRSDTYSSLYASLIRQMTKERKSFWRVPSRILSRLSRALECLTEARSSNRTMWTV